MQIKRTVDFSHNFATALGVATDHDPVGPPEIFNGGAFAQEFRVRGHVDLRIGARFADDLFHFAVGADGNGRFGDDNGIAGQERGDCLGGRENVAQIRMAVAAPAGCPNRDEHRFSPRHGGLQVGLERQPSGLDVGGDHLVETRFEDRNLAPLQPVDLGLVGVHADDIVAEFREAGTRDQSDIAASDHDDTHRISSLYDSIWCTGGTIATKGRSDGSRRLSFFDKTAV